MDPALAKQREEFKKRAIAQPVVEKRRTPFDRNNKYDVPVAKKPKKMLERPVSSISGISRSSGSTGSKFGYLAQIVNLMRTRHQDDDGFPLTIDQILEECNLDDVITVNQKNWLVNEALPNNPKLQVVDHPMQERKYEFKPKYPIRDKKSLYKLLDRFEQRGQGGIMMEDVEESLGANSAKKYVKNLQNHNKIILVTRPDKKQVLFYNDKTCEFTVDEEFQKLWRATSVESMDESKIKEYLTSQGISSVQETKQIVKPIKQRKKANRKRKFKKHNDHLPDVLVDYSENNSKK